MTQPGHRRGIALLRHPYTLAVVLMLVAAMVLVWQSTARNRAQDAAPPSPIEFVGVRWAGENVVRNADGDVVRTDLPIGAKSGFNLIPNLIEVEFIFQAPPDDVLVDGIEIRPAGSDASVTHRRWPNKPIVLPDGDKYVAFSIDMHRTSDRHKNVLGRPKAINRVDIDVTWSAGPEAEGGYGFDGPFEVGRQQAAGRDGALLLACDTPVRGSNAASFLFRRNHVPGRPAHAIATAYDHDGVRHRMIQSHASSDSDSLRFMWMVDGLAMAQVARVTVDEPRQRRTFRGVRIVPPGPPRTTPTWADAMAERLSLTGVPFGKLIEDYPATAADALTVIDIARNYPLDRAVSRAFPRRGPVPTLDEETEKRVRAAVDDWFRSLWEGNWVHGAHVSAMLGLREHMPLILSVLSRDGMWCDRTAQCLARHPEFLTDEDLRAIRDRIVAPGRRKIGQLMQCLGAMRTPEADRLLRELARHEKPHIWWAAIETLNATKRAPVTEGDADANYLARVRLVLPDLRPYDPAVDARAAELARELVTGPFADDASPELTRLMPQLSTLVDKREATDLLVQHIESMLLRDVDGTNVIDAVRELNRLHGTHFGSPPCEPSKPALYAATHWPQLARDVLEWRRAGKVATVSVPKGYRPGPYDFRMVSIDPSKPGQASIVPLFDPALPGRIYRCAIGFNGNGYGILLLMRRPHEKEDYAVSTALAFNGTHATGTNRMSMGGRAFRNSYCVLSATVSPTQNRIYVEPMGSPGGVLKGTPALKEWLGNLDVAPKQ